MADKRFFGRVCRATIVPQDNPTDIVLLDGFDVSFDIEKTREQEPNKGKFTFYNLPESLRKRLQLKDTSKITFEAGYKDNTFVLFEGNLTHAMSGLQGGDWVTNLEAGEGHKVYRKSVVSKTFGKGTPFKTVVEYVVKSFEGMKITPQITSTIADITKSFPSGLTIDGPSARVLNEVLRGVGLAFSIQNGKLEINGSEGSTNDQPITLDYSSGLVNIPQLGEKKDKATINFQCFIRAGMVPFRKVVLLEPASVKGTYVCDSVKPKGSNFDNEYYDHVEAFIP